MAACTAVARGDPFETHRLRDAPLDAVGKDAGMIRTSETKCGTVNQIETDPLDYERSCSPDSNDSALLDQSDGWIVV
jgi:hypothetical protein